MAVAPDQAHRSSALLNHLARLIRMRSEAELEPLGLRPRHLVALTVLRENGGVAGQQELAAELQMDRTNLVGLLNELEAEGLILRRRAAADRRRHIVELTAGGRASAWPPPRRRSAPPRTRSSGRSATASGSSCSSCSSRRAPGARPTAPQPQPSANRSAASSWLGSGTIRM